MAKIVHSDAAPSEAVHYSFANEEFDIEGDGSFETNDPSIITNAEAHPWLTVIADEVEDLRGLYLDTQIKPEDDALSAQNSVANDPDAVRAALEAVYEVEESKTAIEAGLDQDDPETVADVAVTLAAVEPDTDDDGDKF